MRVWSFEEHTLPARWVAAETSSADTPGSWESAPVQDAPDGARVMRLAMSENTGATFNLLMTQDSFPADLDLTVSLRADGGREDQGGGLLWRAQNADNYWITRWNPMERNLRLYVVAEGRRRMVADAELEANAKEWHVLRVIAAGATARVFFDGKELLTATDSALPEGGAIGLWTKADALTSFDQLQLGIPAPPTGPIPGPEPR